MFWPRNCPRLELFSMHIPVLLQSTIEGLNLKTGETVLDATLGLGGHAKAICEKIGSTGTLIGLDQDRGTLTLSEHELSDYSTRKIFKLGNFRNLKKLLAEEGIVQVEAVLFDLGFSSRQMDESGRGFSFQRAEPLLMTLTDEITPETLTAADIVNSWSEENLADIIYGYGEERASRKIAAAIVAAREQKLIETSLELAEIIKVAVGRSFGRSGRIHPATKTFQALRIAVNDELGALREGLTAAWEILPIGGRIAVITFHSLEARIVKEFIVTEKKKGGLELVIKKVVKPNREEILANARSRSAQLRIFKKIKN